MKTATDRTIATLQEWQDVMQHSTSEMDRLLNPLMLSPESPLYAVIWNLQAAYTKAVAELVGDKWDWLDWYARENDMGQNGHECCPGAGHASRKINNVADLAQLIAESS